MSSLMNKVRMFVAKGLPKFRKTHKSSRSHKKHRGSHKKHRGGYSSKSTRKHKSSIKK